MSFTLDGADPGLVAAYLSAEHGIGVRDGRFCAHPLLARLGIPGGALRASVGVGSTLADVDRLLAAVADFLADGPQIPYVQVSGRWQPSTTLVRWPVWAAPTPPWSPAAPAARPAAA